MNRRPDPRYDIANSVQVYVGDRSYFVFLAEEIVVSEVLGRNGKSSLRRVTSEPIKTSALLRASDKVNAIAN